MISSLSLTSRLSLMFTLSVLTVMLLVGTAFKQLSVRHFRVLDQQELSSKLRSAESLLQGVRSRAQFDLKTAELSVLFGDHEGLTAMIFGSDGALWFAEPALFEVPVRYLSPDREMAWEWQHHDRLYRGLSRPLEPLESEQGLSVVLVLDSSFHQHYLRTLEQWFWAAFGLCALASAALGWLVARGGLRPVRAVTGIVSGISARSLSERIPLTQVPGELIGLAQTFNTMLERLDDDFVRLSNFSSDIAHELRTPISSLVTHTEVVLSRPRASEEYREALYSNLEELQRMAKMVEEMLFIAKADNALIVPEQVEVELHGLIEQLFDYYGLLAEEDGIVLKCRGNGVVKGDASMLRRALSNLLSNAIRHSPRGETVSIGIATHNRLLEISVANAGLPIPPEQLERIFDRFYRLDPARREGQSSHAGLGLAITRSIVESHGGTISCDSDDRGTRFMIRLPLDTDADTPRSMARL